MAKTSEIVKMLKAMEKEPLTEDKIDPSSRHLYSTLQYTRLLNKDGELTISGIDLLKDYDKTVKMYESSGVEIVPKNVEGYGNYTFKVRISPNAKKKVVAEPKQKTQETKPSAPNYAVHERQDNSIEEFARQLKRDSLVTDWSIDGDFNLNLETRLPFLRTMTEINELKKFAEEAGVEYRPFGKGYAGAYSLGNVKIIPRKSDSTNKRIQTEKKEYLKITVLPGSVTDNATSKKLVRDFLENFVPYKPNQT